MKIIDKIVKSSVMPKYRHVLWLNTLINKLCAYINNEWIKIN